MNLYWTATTAMAFITLTGDGAVLMTDTSCSRSCHPVNRVSVEVRVPTATPWDKVS